MALVACQCYPQRQHLGVLQLFRRQFEEESSCFGEVIEFKGAFNGGKAGTEAVYGGGFTEDGGAGLFGEIRRGILHDFQIDILITLPGPDEPVERQDQDDSEEEEGKIKNPGGPHHASNFPEHLPRETGQEHAQPDGDKDTRYYQNESEADDEGSLLGGSEHRFLLRGHSRIWTRTGQDTTARWRILAI